MRAGDVFTEVKSSDTGSTCGTGNKQGSTTWDVTITNNAGDAAASVDSLASIAGTYTIRVTAGGSVKLSLTQTSALTADKETPVYNFRLKNDPSDEGESAVTPATGALGVAAAQAVDVMQIVINADGSVKYKTDASASFVSSGTSWANTLSPVQSAVTYYGLEVLNDTAEASPTVADNSKLTPDVKEF